MLLNLVALSRADTAGVAPLLEISLHDMDSACSYGIGCARLKTVVRSITEQGGVAMKFTRCGLDIAKQVFQVHHVNEHEVVKGRRTLPRVKVLSSSRNCRRA